MIKHSMTKYRMAKYRTIFQLLKVTLASIFISLFLCACGTSNLLTSDVFNGKAHEQARTPLGSVAYVCDNNAQFYVRMLNNANDAWLIYPDHEVNLPKQADGRYSNGSAVFSPSAESATLTDGEKVNYTACKAQVKAVK